MASTDLRAAAQRLRNADPLAFDEWVKAFSTYSQQVSAQLAFAPDVNELLKHQGRAQQCHSLLVTFEDVVKATKPAPQ